MSIADIGAERASRTTAPTEAARPVAPRAPFPAANHADDTHQSDAVAPTRSSGYVMSMALFLLAALALGFVANLVVVSPLEHQVAQTKAFNLLRYEFAQGTAPIHPRDAAHKLLALGTPIAVLDIPAIGVKEVVSEGTTSAVLIAGPGHERSTVFPGGAGTSVILGRAAAYGGPFGRLNELRTGALIKVTTQVGTSTFRVIDRRKAGDVIPHLAQGRARLTLATASGPAFVPSGVLWIDANLVGSPLAASKPAMHSLPGSERPLGIDIGSLWLMALWLGALVLLLGGAFWTWHRRGHARAWIIFSAPVAVVSLFIAAQITLLLPNLM
jgi:sortase A